MPPLALLDRLHQHATARPDEVAYLDATTQRTLTWRAFAAAVAAHSHTIRSALPNAGVVLLAAPNTLEYPIAFMSILAAGCDVFPIAPDLADAELRRAAEQSNAAAVIGHAKLAAVLPQLNAWAVEAFSDAGPQTHARASGSGGLLLQSSGTTGLPKIVRRSGASLDAVSAAMAAAVGFGAAEHVLAAVPLTHSYGLEHGLLAPVWAGSTVHLCRGLDLPAVIAELGRGRITLFPAVPAMFEMLANVTDVPPITSLRTAYSAGAPLPATVLERFRERFGVTVAQLYGATEIGSVTFNNPHDLPFDPASVGRPMTGVSVRILDVTTTAPLPPGEEGHVAIRSAGMFDGYLHNPTDLIDGYFPTGDLGRIDERGRLFITGRLKLLIDVGGMKVNPLEVEAVLLQHPRVGAAVVVPIRQSETVNRLKAIVTPRDPAHPPSGEELRAFAKSHLSGYKIPRMYEVRDALPRSATGKVLRHQVETG